MNTTYPKSEKLKQKLAIDLLFTAGESVSKYPLRLVYVSMANETDGGIKIGVSVSKKYFKKAVDRNRYKRLLREAYRLNKHLLTDAVPNKYALMLFYQSSEQLSYEEINEKTVQLFQKFKSKISRNNNVQ